MTGQLHILGIWHTTLLLLIQLINHSKWALNVFVLISIFPSPRHTQKRQQRNSGKKRCYSYKYNYATIYFCVTKTLNILACIKRASLILFLLSLSLSLSRQKQELASHSAGTRVGHFLTITRERERDNEEKERKKKGKFLSERSRFFSSFSEK